MKHNIEELYKMQQQDLHYYVLNHISKKNTQIIAKNGNYLLSIPESKSPIICCHIDTKLNIIPKHIQIIDNKQYIGLDEDESPCILGADDRNGVWTALELFENYYDQLGFIFTWDEEIGCLGTKELIDSHLPLIKQKSAYFIQIDRKSTNDLAYYVYENRLLMSPEFNDRLSQFENYYVVQGSSTDVKYLSYYTGISGINISAGYYNEHTSFEYSDIDYVNNLPSTVVNLINHLGNKSYPLKIS